MSDPLYAIERAAIAEEVASVIRHDMRNRLLSVRNASFYIRRRVEPTELWKTDARVPTFFDLIDGELKAASELLQERVVFGHMFGKLAAPVRLSACVAQSLEAREVPASLQITRELAEDDVVVADPLEMALAARCLIDNAVEAMPEGGSLHLKTSRSADTVTLEVTDRGPGFTEAQLERGIRPFETKKPGHVGLGLAIAQRITSRYGGGVTLSSSGSGATVLLQLPAADAAQEAATSESPT